MRRSARADRADGTREAILTAAERLLVLLLFLVPVVLLGVVCRRLLLGCAGSRLNTFARQFGR